MADKQLTEENLLHLKVHLSPACRAELIIQGEITDPAIRRLIAFLELTLEAWSIPGPAEAEEKELKTKGENES